MARIRTIKPDFFTSEDIVNLSPLARLLYIATWCEADKEGRLTWKPRTLKLRYLPGDDCNAEELAEELVNAGLVIPYGENLAVIPAFQKHQHINPRESESSLPAPPAGLAKAGRKQEQEPPQADASARVDDASARVGTRANLDVHAQGGREGKGKEGNTSPSNEGGGRKRLPTPACPDEVEPQTWSDWLSLRKAKKAPVTVTVIDQAAKEAAKAGLSLDAFLRIWCARGSQGLQADWLKPAEVAQYRGNAAPLESFRERDTRLAAQKVAAWTGGLAHDRSALGSATTALFDVLEEPSDGRPRLPA